MSEAGAGSDGSTDMTTADFERALTFAANRYCSCGGKGPRDPGVCVACSVCHAAMDLMHDLEALRRSEKK